MSNSKALVAGFLATVSTLFSCGDKGSDPGPINNGGTGGTNNGNTNAKLETYKFFSSQIRSQVQKLKDPETGEVVAYAPIDFEGKDDNTNKTLKLDGAAETQIDVSLKGLENAVRLSDGSFSSPDTIKIIITNIAKDVAGQPKPINVNGKDFKEVVLAGKNLQTGLPANVSVSAQDILNGFNEAKKIGQPGSKKYVNIFGDEVPAAKYRLVY